MIRKPPSAQRRRKIASRRPGAFQIERLEKRVLLSNDHSTLADFVIFANKQTEIAKNVTVVDGLIGTHQSFPGVELPAASVFSSDPANDISTPKRAAISLAPGRYGDLRVAKQNTLRLSSGQYFFDRISAAKDLVLTLDVSAGELAIFVQGPVSFDKGLKVKLEGGGPERVFLETHNTFTLDKDGKWFGTIYSPNHEIQLGAHTTLVGAAYSGTTVGVGSRASLDVAPASRLRAETDPPLLAAALVNDTAAGGGTNRDGVTSDPAIAGTVSDASQIVALRAGFDMAPSDGFLDVFAELRADGTFSLPRMRLEQINGGPLSKGPHTLHLQATDEHGNTSSFFEVFFTLDTVPPEGLAPTTPDLEPSADTGKFSADDVTAEATPTFVGTAEPGALVALLDDGTIVGLTAADAAGNWTVRSARLADGVHRIAAAVTDVAGNLGAISAELAVTIDTAPPLVPAFELSPGSDTGPVGDQQTSAARVTLVGRTDPGSELALLENGMTALVSNSGAFRFPDVALADGVNNFSTRATDLAGNTSQFQATITHAGEVSESDAVLAWDRAALEAIRLDSTPPPVASRALAMTSLAMYDALSAVEGTPPYAVALAAPADASPSAAVASAAHTVLSYLFPGQQVALDAQLAESLGQVPDGPAEEDGQSLGRSIGDAIIALRAGDGWDTFIDYLAGAEPGQWQPTAPMFDLALLPQWASVDPFAMTAPDQFRPAGPPALESQAYADAVNEVKQLGSAVGSSRTDQQTEIARFWADGPGTYTPPGHWNRIAAQIALERGNSLSANARLLAELNLALADASIVAWNAKYADNFWRPVAAIHQADSDDNPDTQSDVAWSPLLITPPFPEYVSGHSTFSGAAAEILTHSFGDNIAFTTDSFGLPGIERSFASFQQAAAEAGRSRVYGGIHFEFSNQDGLAAGRSLAQYVLDSFSASTDTRPPQVLVSSPAPDVVAAANFTVAGRVLDNLSGVATLQVQLDDAAFAGLPFDAQGNFILPTTLSADGSADGPHVLRFRASDAAGNTAPVVQRSFTLDTRSPQITLTGPAAGEIGAGAVLSGTADGTGSALTRLTYRFDTGPIMPVAFDRSIDSFDQPLDLSRLTAGPHTLAVTARDAADHEATVQVPVNLTAAIPFTVTSFVPQDGADEVGTTFRPQVFFSRPVDPASLSANNFFATGPNGAKLSANIVPAGDGSFAWLFFSDPMPGASLITLHVDGSSIRAAADGALLDANGDGQPGGELEYTFTTVSLTPLVGTTLSGKLVDPGPDLKPMTFDDIRSGADQPLHTADDVFLLPIEHVKVFIVGLDAPFVFTDAAGNFRFDAVPAGDVKLALDGRTATNVPTGFYFPEMVMDLNLEVGRDNTVMGTMGSREDREANLDRAEVYLPRLQTSLLHDVSNTQPTMIGVDAESAPNLTPEQRAMLSIAVQPGSLVDENGNPLAAGQVGISTVPPELVRDMLPPGLLQHTFDITVQAPGITNFSTPAPMTFPNTFNAPPGSQLNFLSFDHTTGRLVIEGTATVAADGKSATTDPGTGITHPGWHGLAAAGSQNDPPCNSFPHDREVPPVPVTEGLHDYLFTDDAGSFALSFGNAARPIDPSQDPCSPENVHATPLVVKVKFDEIRDKFLIGPKSRQEIFKVLYPGQQSTIPIEVRDLLKSANVNAAMANILYGTRIAVSAWQSGEPQNLLIDQKLYVYRLFDIADDDHDDGRVDFEKTFADGLDGAVQEKPLRLALPFSAQPQLPVDGGDKIDFSVAPFTNTISFDPLVAADFSEEARSAKLRVLSPEHNLVGTIGLGGTAVAAQWVIFPRQDFFMAMKDLADSAVDPMALEFVDTVFPPDLDMDFLRSDEVGFQDTVNKYYDDVVHNLTETYSFVAPALLIDEEGSRVGIKVNVVGVGTTGYGTSLEFLASSADRTGEAVRVGDARSVTYSIRVGSIDPGVTVHFRLQQFKAGIWSDVPLPDKSKNAIRPGDTGQEFSGNADINTRFVRVLATQQGAGSAEYEVKLTGNGQTCGGAIACAIWADFNRSAFLNTLVQEQDRTSGPQERYRFDSYTNRSLKDDPGWDISGVAVILDRNARLIAGATDAPLQFTNYISNDLAHEIGHALGAIHERSAVADYVDIGSVMGFSRRDILNHFTSHFQPVIQFAVGREVSPQRFPDMYDYYAKYAPLEKYGFNPSDDTTHLPTDGPVLTVFGGPVAVGTPIPPTVLRVDMGQVLADGDGGQLLQVPLFLLNDGDADLTVSRIELADGLAGFALERDGTVPVVLPPLDPDQLLPDLSTHVVTLLFDPARAGTAHDLLRIVSDSVVGGVVKIPLEGIAVSPFGDMQVEVPNNNVGGLELSEPPRSVSRFGTIQNTGASPLTISNIVASPRGLGQFSVGGLPAGFGPAQPIVLNPGESFSFDVSFDARVQGLQRGQILIFSDEPDTPIFTQAVVGTGLADVGSASDYGRDFVAVETLLAPQVLRQVSDDQGNWSFFLPANEPIHTAIFDPVSGLIAHAFDVTAPSGQNTELTTPVFLASTEPDSDGDGLPDDIEFAIGTSTSKTDTDRDGVSDFAEIEQGLDPLGGRSFPTGVIAGVNVFGEAKEIVVEGSVAEAASQIAYVATGSYGLAIVDASQFDKPVVLSQLDLPGDNRDVAFDPVTGLVAVAAGPEGLHVVDVSDPSSPRLRRTVSMPRGANRVEVFDGSAYVASGPFVISVDLSTGQLLQTLTPTGNDVVDLAREGATLIAVDATSRLKVIDLGGELMLARGSLAVPGPAGRLFVGNGLSYVTRHVIGGQPTSGGFSTIDITDPDQPRLISGPDQLGRAPGTDIAVNGSNLAILVGSDSGMHALDVMNVADPADTNAFLTRINLPAAPLDVALASGIAYLAEGTAGLAVVNFLPFDNLGQAPAVSISSSVADADGTVGGIQVREGSTIPLRLDVTDDVQVQSVELLVNGTLVQKDVSFPWELSAIALGTDPLTIQVRATDTGGNSALSNVLEFALFRDVTAPSIVSTNPADGATANEGLLSVQIRFSEPMAAATITAASVQLHDAAGNPIASQSFMRKDDRLLQLVVAPLAAGDYQIVIDAAAVTDRSGNPLGGADVVSRFSLKEPSATSGPPSLFPLRLYETDDAPLAIATGDLDGDGDLDIVTSNRTVGCPCTVSVLLANGDGTFANKVDYSIGFTTGDDRSIALGNLDGDGDLDLVVGGSSTGLMAVLPGNGDGTFQAARLFTRTSDTLDLALGDLNRDGKLDLVAANGIASLSVQFGNGDGTFEPETEYALQHPERAEIRLADLDNDGDLDLTEVGGGIVSVFLNQGDGIFGARTDFGAGELRGLEVGDVNGDGNPDLVSSDIDCCVVGLPHLTVRLGSGDGTFLAPVSSTGLQVPPLFLRLADFDRDGDLDLVGLSGCCGSANPVRIFLGAGDGTFEPQRDYLLGEGSVTMRTELLVGDFNGDGASDVAALNAPGSNVGLLLNKGDGTFDVESDFKISARIRSVAVGDMDGDGDLDAVVGDFPTPRVLRGNDDGSFAPTADDALNFDSQPTALGDLDGDGDLDVVVANLSNAFPGQGSVSVFLNNFGGLLGLGLPTDYAVGGGVNTVALADFDRDGDLDMIAANQQRGFSVLVGNGDGTLGARTDYTASGEPSSLALGDINEDGLLDAISVFQPQNTSTIHSLVALLGGANGTFSGPVSLLTDTSRRFTAVTVGDLDGDGHMDLVASDDPPFARGRVVVLLGNGDRTFTAPAEYTVGHEPRAIALADVDGDGDPDIVTANRQANSFSVLPNNGDGTFAGQSHTQYAVGGEEPISLALGDLDSDGDIDVITGNARSLSPRLNRSDVPVPSLAVRLRATIADADPAAAGVQVFEGQTIPFRLGVFGNVPLQQVEFLVNGQLTGADATAPFEFSTVAPNIGAQGNQLTFQALASTAGGGQVHSNLVTLAVIEDSVSPAVTSFSPPDGADLPAGLTQVEIESSESLAAAGVTTATFQLRDAQGDPVAATSVQLLNDDRLVHLEYDPLPAGDYQIVIDAPAVTDRAGNPLGNAAIASSFTLTVPQLRFLFPDPYYPAGAGPSSLASGDLNGDGGIDLVIANRADNTVSVLLATESDLFGTNIDFTVGTTPQAVVLVDLDADGFLDVVTANQDADSVSVLLGNGDGTFDPKTDYTVGDRPLGVASGDVNGDGLIDLVTVNDFGNSISVLRGSGLGVFLAKVDFPTGSRPQSLALGDLDGDGDLDVVTGNTGGDTASVLRGNGNGTFGAKTDFAVGSFPRGLALGDLNADGDLDLVSANQGAASVSVLIGNGNGTFAAKTDFAADDNAFSVILSDLDGDGDRDLAVADAGANTVSVLLANGDGTFVAKTDYPAGASPTSLAAVDVDGDGDRDLVAVGTSGAFVLVANGGGTFDTGSADYAVGGRPQSLAKADFNGDGRLDLVSANGADDTISVLLGLGDGSFDAKIDFTVGSNPRSVAVGDLDRDGDIDVVTANDSFSAMNVSVLLNTGDALGPKTDLALGTRPAAVALGDVDRDGDLDMLTANFDDDGSLDSVAILLGNGDATFAAPTHIIIGGHPIALALGDLDGDGDLDLVTADKNTPAVSVRLGNGDGTFGGPTDYAVASDTNAIVLGDLDGDGDLDMVTGHRGDARTVSVLLGKGDGTFAAKTDYAVGPEPGSVALGDIDGDQDVDIVTANTLGNSVSVLLGDGTGVFAGRTDYATGGGPASVVLGDFDGDGDVDFVTANSSGNSVSPRLNRIVQPGSPLRVANEAIDAAADPQLVTPASLQPLVAVAIARWIPAGIDVRLRHKLDDLQVQIADLPGSYLAWVSAIVLTIDRDAAGYGWFIDPSPDDDVEFRERVSEHQLRAIDESLASGRMDLLTVLSHELGHLLGLEHLDPQSRWDVLMAATLESGVRRSPAASEIDALLSRDAWRDPLNSPAVATHPVALRP